MSDPRNRGMTYAKFFPSDWRTGCLILSLEEEGLYIRVVAYMYDTGNPVPADDHQAARLLNVQIQKYEKVMGALIEKGKMFRGQGWIINERVMEELEKWKLDHLARSEAAKKREADRRAQMQQGAVPLRQPPGQPPGQPPHQPPGGSLGGPMALPLDVPHEVNGKIANEINVPIITVLAQPCQASATNPESRIQKPEKKERDSTTTVEQDPRVGGGAYLDCLNGAAVDLTAFIARQAMVDPDIARNMLATNIKTFGAEAMLEAYAVTLAETTSSLIAKPYKYLIETARRIKTASARTRGKDPTAPEESRRERIKRYVEEESNKLGQKERRP